MTSRSHLHVLHCCTTYYSSLLTSRSMAMGSSNGLMAESPAHSQRQHLAHLEGVVHG